MRASKLREAAGLRLCLVLSAASFAPFAAAQSTLSLPTATVVTPIFGELFAHSIPAGFRGQAEQTNGDLYLRALVLASDLDAEWKQRILTTGKRATGQLASLTSKQFAMQIARGFQQSCPATFSGGAMAEGKIGTGHGVYIMLVSCGSHTLTTTKAATSESALVAVVQGDQNFYSVQWSERGAPVDRAPTANLDLWSSRLKAITPFLVCERRPEEAPPYPSCLQRKN